MTESTLVDVQDLSIVDPASRSQEEADLTLLEAAPQFRIHCEDR